MLTKVISGGQTGADQAALHAATAAGIPTGGWGPVGWRTEDGTTPWLAEFGLTECREPGCPARTLANARDSDGTLWFGDRRRPKGKAALDACRSQGKPLLIVYQGTTKPSEVVAWAREQRIQILHVAGHRESRSPGIGARVERFLGEVFRRLVGGEG